MQSTYAVQSENQAWCIGRTKRLCTPLSQADPPPAVLQAFDDLLLLKSGGLVTYHGSLGKNSCRLIEYFQVQPACPSIPIKSPAPSALMHACPQEAASAAVVGLLHCLCHSRGLFACTEC